MQLTLLVRSPRVAPGLMTWTAWSAVAGADRRLASDPSSVSALAVVDAGHTVEASAWPPRVGDGETVLWLASEEEADALPGLAADAPWAVDVLHASYDVPGGRLLDLVAVMDRLRRECPWDREQTHRSLAPYLLEETYEVLETIDSEQGPDLVHLREELGDLLLQVYFHARLAQEDEGHGFDIDDVAGDIVAKLVHRHPHVFAGDDGVHDAADVQRNWEVRKAREKGRTSVLDGIPAALPALALADKTVGRAARVGVVPAAGATLGDRLLAVVGEARLAGEDAEQALRDAVRRLADDVRAAEARVIESQTGSRRA